MKLGLCRAPSYADVSETVAKAFPCQSRADISETIAMVVSRQSCADVSGRWLRLCRAKAVRTYRDGSIFRAKALHNRADRPGGRG